MYKSLLANEITRTSGYRDQNRGEALIAVSIGYLAEELAGLVDELHEFHVAVEELFGILVDIKLEDGCD